MDLKKLAVLAAGIALGEFAWREFIGPAVVGKFVDASADDEFGLDDVLRYATSGAGVLVLQKFL